MRTCPDVGDRLVPPGDAVLDHATDGWFADQFALCLLGVTATFAWEKALGSEDELGWWAEHALRGAALLDRRAPAWR